MNTRIRTTATLLSGIAAGTAIVLAATPTSASNTAAASAASAGASRPSTETMVLAFPWQGGHQRFIDTGKKGIGPGDVFLGVGMPILNNRTGDRVCSP